MKKRISDYAIIGGGLSGYSCAYWLNRLDPKAKVSLIASKSPYLVPASTQNAGFLTVGSLDFYLQNQRKFGESKANKIYQFCKENHQSLQKEGILEQCTSYINQGSFSITSTTVTAAPEDFTSAIDPKVVLKPNESVWLNEQDGSVDPGELLTTIKQSCEASLVNAEAREISATKVVTNEGEFEARKVVVATNAWISELLKKLRVEPTRAQALRTRPIGKALPANYYFSDDRAYVRVCNDNSLVVGGMRSLDLEAEATAKMELNQKIQGALLKLATERFGVSVEIEKQWSGIMGFTDSHLPMAGEYNGIYYQAGFSGHGMGMCFLMAKHLVQFLLNQGPLPDWLPDRGSN